MKVEITLEYEGGFTYDLEYKESTGQFHHNRKSHPANTNGWVTIAEDLREPKLSQFCNYIEELYKGQLGRAPCINPTAATIKEEWIRFCLIYRWITDYDNQSQRKYKDPRYVLR